MTVKVRRARASEASVAADIFIRARHHAAAEGSIPAMVGTDDGARGYWDSLLAGTSQTYLAFDGDEPVAVMNLHDGWVDQLYVLPGHTNAGVGTRLLTFAKEQYPERLQLWTFQSNTGAHRFYERHGFVAVERTDGDNMEKAPDVRYVWSGTR